MLLDQCTILRNLSLSFSDPEICRDLMELADKCEALAKKLSEPHSKPSETPERTA